MFLLPFKKANVAELANKAVIASRKISADRFKYTLQKYRRRLKFRTPCYIISFDKDNLSNSYISTHIEES